MRPFLTKATVAFLMVTALYGVNAWFSASPEAAPAVSGQGPTFKSIGPLAFAPDGTLFAADNDAALVFALDVKNPIAGEAAGAKDIADLDRMIAATLGGTPSDIKITDLAVHPKSHNVFVSVRRGNGQDAKAALLRIDGNGAIHLVPFDMSFSSVGLPGRPTGLFSGGARTEFITDMALVGDRLWVAGLSNEEFSSKLRAVPYPFNATDNGTSVEIFHGSHGALETRSPIYTFVPFAINGEPYLIAGYLCTPLVKFPVAALKPGEKVRGVTIAELGNMNRPLDMIAYQKDGRDFLLMSNNSRGVMKIPAATIASAEPITAPVKTEKAGIRYETITQWRGVEELDLFDADHAALLSRNTSGALDLRIHALP